MKFIAEINGVENIKSKYAKGNDNLHLPPDNPVKGLKYYIVLDRQVEFDVEFEKLRPENISKTTEKYNGYEHLLIAYQEYTVVPLQVEATINSLNNALGIYLDSNYMPETRDKHLREMTLGKATGQRLKYLKELDAWMDECRIVRDLKEQNIRSGNKVDFYDWPTKPEETTN